MREPRVDLSSAPAPGPGPRHSSIVPESPSPSNKHQGRRSPPLNGALLAPAEEQAAELPAGPPILIVSIDTESEFDWNGPFLRTQTSVRNVRNQSMAQEIFDRFGVRPIYLVDYAVATQPEAYLPLREIFQSKRCEIGAHLHPWITPPFLEELGARASFSQNLPVSLQRVKLTQLTEAIERSFDFHPLAYRAGRLGVGEEIAEILVSLGYQIDMSVLPGIDMRRIYGPDFRQGLDRPYWFGSDLSLLEIPATPCFAGLLAGRALPKAVSIELYDQLSRPSLERFRIRGVFSRLRLLEWIPPSPEGVTLTELHRLTREFLSRSRRVFVLSYHSSSLLPGSTQYVQSASDLTDFLGRIEGFLDFFIGKLGGVTMTPSELRAVLPQRQQPQRFLPEQQPPAAAALLGEAGRAGE